MPTGESLRQSFAAVIGRVRRSPMYVATLVLTIMLGVGVNVAIFSVVNAVLLTPLPFAAPAQLVEFSYAERAEERSRPGIPVNAYLAAKGNVPALTEIGAFAWGRRDTVLNLGDRAYVIYTTSVTREFFPVLGVAPVAGRWPAQYGEVAVSAALWRRIDDGDGAFHERPVLVEGGERFIVVGVMPEDFAYPVELDMWGVWRPGRVPGAAGQPVVGAVARAMPGQSLGAIDRQLAAIAQAEIGRGASLRAASLVEERRRVARGPLLATWATVNIVLLMTVLNVAGLFSARIFDRSSDLATRRILGARIRDLLSSWVAEAVLISAVGASAAVSVAFAFTRWLAQSIPSELAEVVPGIRLAGMGRPVILWSLFVTALLVVVSTALPFGALLRRERQVSFVGRRRIA